MNTTILLVELFVVGFGAAIWMVLVALTFLGYESVRLDTVGSWGAPLPALAIVYVLGIIIDRLADSMFRRADRQLRERAYAGSAKDYHYVRTYVFYRAEKFEEIFDHARSKLRICRAWVFNFALSGLASVLLIWARMPDLAASTKWLLSALALFAGALLATGSWYAWHRLTDTYYVRLLHAYAVLREIEESR